MSDPLTILHGHCMDVLAALPAESVHCCVTSPPFLWLRDYGLSPVPWPEVVYRPLSGVPEVTVPAQSAVLGLEEDPLAYIGHLVAVFREVRRVLRADGTCWVEIGDGYAKCGGPGHQGKHGQRAARRHTQLTLKWSCVSGLKPKDLIGTPQRLALALQADGWYWRQEIIWHKRNPMPESCKDRPTRAHSTILMLSRSPRYWYDAESVAEECSAMTHARGAGVNPKALREAKHNASRKERAYDDQKCLPTTERNGIRPARRPRGWQEGQGAHDTIPKGSYPRARQNESFAAAVAGMVTTRNSRSVWTLSVGGYRGRHYATFTGEVPRRCLLAGCPPGGVVLDPFGGAGTTGLAALEAGRAAILIEAQEEYVRQARERLSGVQLGLSWV